MDSAAVLIIDDDPDFRELLRLCLDGLPIEVLDAEDCVSGVALLGEAGGRVAVILLDYWMPGLSPVRCIGRIRALAPSARVVLVTAAVDARTRARELGLADWFAKPFDVNRLREMVRASLPAPPQVPA